MSELSMRKTRSAIAGFSHGQGHEPEIVDDLQKLGTTASQEPAKKTGTSVHGMHGTEFCQQLEQCIPQILQ